MGKISKKTSAIERPKSRKQLRREKRLLKKQKRSQSQSKRNKIVQLAESGNSDDEYSTNTKKIKKTPSDIPSSNNSCTFDRQLKQKQKEMKNFKKLEHQMRVERKRQLLEANEKEDRIIKSLEKKLKLDKRKNKSISKAFVAEGLDYLLEVCDFSQYKDSINLERELNENVIDFDDDLAVAAGTKTDEEMNSDDESNDFDDEMNNFNYSGSEAVDDDCDDSDVSEYSSGIEKKKLKMTNTKQEKTKPEKRFLESKGDTKKNEAEKPECRKKPKEGTTKFETSRTESKVSIKKNEVEKTESKKKPNVSDRMKMLQAFVSEESNTRVESDIDDSLSEDEHQNENLSEEEPENTKSKNEKFHEDIYGRLRDEDGNIVQSNQGKYIPPHLRVSSQTSDDNSEVIQRLRKLIKGALNRLTENNMYSISVQMEDIYSKYSRNDTSSVLLKLLKESIISPVLSPERIVIEHALLVSLLHGNIGSEIGAFILQNLVEELLKLFDDTVCVEDKRIDNVVMFLCQLYNFKVIHACLIYEILNKFIEKFQEKEVELILLVLKNVGFILRKDDPVALKELIFNVQKKSSESVALRESARVRFMLDSLSAVKNNNTLKIQNYDPSYVEHLRKIQKSFLRPGKYVTELKISLEDLSNADTKGRWWIVGSAWTGHNANKVQSQELTSQSSANVFDQSILNLAKKHRMNTDARRNIFCILMTAEDFIDAFEKLVKLGLRGQQYREIINVLMHCLLKEKKYNPYYAFIAEQFCSVDRKYQLAIQFSTWDKFKEINSFTSQQITNLAKFLAYLFVELKLPLSVLKVLQFAEMNKSMVKLIRQIVLTILLTDDDSVVVDVFSRIAKSEKLFLLREGLQLFLHHFVLKNIEKDAIGDDSKLETLSKHVELAVTVMRGSSSSL